MCTICTTTDSVVTPILYTHMWYVVLERRITFFDTLHHSMYRNLLVSLSGIENHSHKHSVYIL